MTDRINSLTVVLENEMRDDDAEQLISAIKMMRGVLNVSGIVSDHIDNYIAEERVRRELGKKLWEVIYPKKV